MDLSLLLGERDGDRDAALDDISRKIDSLRDSPALWTSRSSPGTPTTEWDEVFKPAVRAVVPPIKPLTFDILLNVAESMGSVSDLPLLNTIRQTCRSANRMVERQVISVHNYHVFQNHKRLARLCLAVLRRPHELLPMLHTLRIGLFRDSHAGELVRDGNGDEHGTTSRRCICVDLLAALVSQSHTLTTLVMIHAESFFNMQPLLGSRLATSVSLRELELQGGVGTRTMAMLAQMRALRKLEVNLYDWDDLEFDEVFLPSLLGVRSSLEELFIDGNDTRVLGISHDGDDRMVWPRLHTLHLAGMYVETPELVKAFPNLRDLTQGDEAFGGMEAQRQRSHDLAMCWRNLDTLALTAQCLWGAGLTRAVRRLRCLFLENDHDVCMLVEDLPVLKPVVFQLELDIPPAVISQGDRFSPVAEPPPSASVATRIWQSLPRTKTLGVTFVGHAESLTIEAIDEYVLSFTTNIRVSSLEFLKVTMKMQYPHHVSGLTEDDFERAIAEHAGTLGQQPDASSARMMMEEELEHAPSSPGSVGRARGSSGRPVYPLKEQLESRMAEHMQRELVLSVADANPALRYVCLNPWSEHAFLSNAWYWEVSRDNEISTLAPTVRRLTMSDGERLWEQWQDVDA